MIAIALQAAAEYVGVMIANGIRGIGTATGRLGDWAAAHPVELFGGLLALFLLRMMVRRTGTRR